MGKRSQKRRAKLKKLHKLQQHTAPTAVSIDIADHSVPEHRVVQESPIQKMRPYLAYIAWVQALIAMLGSLFFSEVMKLPPCVLCWYQRIATYPLVFILAAGILLNDARLKWYALPLSITGLVIAIYHNLLYYGIIPESITPCTAGISCTTRQIEWFGFITIPFLSLIAFTVITVALCLYKKGETNESN